MYRTRKYEAYYLEPSRRVVLKLEEFRRVYGFVLTPMAYSVLPYIWYVYNP